MTGDLNTYVPVDEVRFEELEYYYSFLNDVFRDHLISSFSLLVDEIGETEALIAIKPLMRHDADYVYHEVKKNFGIEGNGPDALLASYIFGSMGVSNDLSGELMERGAVGITRNCVLKEAPLSLCFAISHFISEGMCDVANPDYECIWTDHETNGDKYCRYVFKRKSDRIPDLNDLGASISPIPIPPIGGLPRLAMRRWALVGFWRNVSDVFDARMGTEKARRLLGENAFGIGSKAAIRLMKDGKIKALDLDSVGNVLDNIGKAMNQRGTCTKVGEGSIIKEVTDCSNQQNISINCWQIKEFLNGLSKGFNPDLEFSYESMILDGGKNCKWTLSDNSSSGHGERGRLKTRLLTRFVEGEISEEEYRRMKRVIEE
jgi:hypothetical protein